MSGAQLWLGDASDPTTHERQAGAAVAIDADDLCTHGVIVGMTGSGKTGLGIVVLEEALKAGVPVLAIDLKGDLTNLLLQGATDLAPFVPPGTDPVAAAASWAEGLAGWGIDGPAVAALASGHRSVVYTPGSTAGVPLDLFGSLRAPTSTDAEVRADEAESIVTGLLGLIGIDADPLSSREHILLVNLLQKAWAEDRAMDLGGLVLQVQDPPLRRLGVIELEAFFPKADRAKLAVQLNGLLASPSFAAWNQGVGLDIASMLWAPDGRPTCAVVYLAHLSDEERQTVVALVLSKLVTWMRGQRGSTALRALAYLDEVAGYVPPTAVPPAKKPILTLLKQARAFGVGMVLATQNPVDLDYKAISNAGTWLVGRLQTERDRDRLLDGMSSAAGGVDLGALGATIGGLAKREFVLHRAGGQAPRTLATRWAVSYLAGPLAREQLAQLPGQAAAMALVAAPGDPSGPAGTAVPAAAALADDEVGAPPEVAAGVPVRWVDPAAPWAAQLRAVAGSPRHRAALAVRVALRFDEGDLVHDDEHEALYPLVEEQLDPSWAVVVDYDDRDLRPEPPPGATYVVPVAPIGTKAFFTAASRAIEDQLARTRTHQAFRNAALKLVSRPGEDEAAFRARCEAAADDGADAAADKLRARYAARTSRAEVALARAIDRSNEVQATVQARRQDELLGDAGALLGAVLGGRSRTRGLARALGGASGRRGRSSQAATRQTSAAHRVEDARDAVAALEDELAAELTAIAAEWDAKAAQVEPLPITLEKADISITQLALAWVPVARP